MALGELSEEARNDLLEMCEEQFAHLKKVKMHSSLTGHFYFPLPKSVCVERT